MTLSRTLRTLALPVALAGAVALAGCSSAAEPAAPTVEIPSTDLQSTWLEDRLNSSDESLNKAVAELSEKLDTAVPGVVGVSLGVIVDTVDVAVVLPSTTELRTDDDEDRAAMSGDQLKALLAELKTFAGEHPEIASWSISVVDGDDWPADLLLASDELGLSSDVVDREWNVLNIPSDQL